VRLQLGRWADTDCPLVSRIRRKRPELRLIVSSATMDANYFLEYFSERNSTNDAVIVSLEGRMYPVQIAYADEPVPNIVERSAHLAWRIHLQVKCTFPSVIKWAHSNRHRTDPEIYSYSCRAGRTSRCACKSCLISYRRKCLPPSPFFGNLNSEQASPFRAAAGIGSPLCWAHYRRATSSILCPRKRQA